MKKIVLMIGVFFVSAAYADREDDLINAVMYRNVEGIRTALRGGADPDVRRHIKEITRYMGTEKHHIRRGDYTPLGLAADTLYVEGVEELLKSPRTDVKAKSAIQEASGQNEMTPLEIVTRSTPHDVRAQKITDLLQKAEKVQPKTP